MSRNRHSVVRIPAPTGWRPMRPDDVPPAAVVLHGLSLGEAARVAIALNESELAAPSGVWHLAAKTLKRRAKRSTRAARIIADAAARRRTVFTERIATLWRTAAEMGLADAPPADTRKGGAQ